MTYIDIGKGSKTKNVKTLGAISDKPEIILYGIVGIVVIFSLLTGGIV